MCGVEKHLICVSRTLPWGSYARFFLPSGSRERPAPLGGRGFGAPPQGGRISKGLWAAAHAETPPSRVGPDRVPGTRVGPPPAGVISQAAGRAGLGTPPAFGARGAGIIIIIIFIITCILQCTCAIIISRVSHFTRARGSPPAKWPRRALWLCCRICLCAALRGGHGVVHKL